MSKEAAKILVEGSAHPVREKLDKEVVTESEARKAIADVRASGKGDARIVEEAGSKKLKFRDLLRG